MEQRGEYEPSVPSRQMPPSLLADLDCFNTDQDGRVAARVPYWDSQAPVELARPQRPTVVNRPQMRPSMDADHDSFYKEQGRLAMRVLDPDAEQVALIAAIVKRATKLFPNRR